MLEEFIEEKPHFDEEKLKDVNLESLGSRPIMPKNLPRHGVQAPN